jgi:hypothetical protein
VAESDGFIPSDDAIGEFFLNCGAAIRTEGVKLKMQAMLA